MKRLTKDFFRQDAVTLAKSLLGKTLMRAWPDGSQSRFIITETEAYLGEEDLACHASKGRTPRTEIMYAEGGALYVYIIYGMYWLLNIVSGRKDHPEAVLIRAFYEVNGPGRVGKTLQLDKSFYGEDLNRSERLWLEDAPDVTAFSSAPRIGIDYAGDHWKNIRWRFTINFDQASPPPKPMGTGGNI
ncbi:MAG: DNA-3-methyladenine glycosylase [Paludibacter sp.]|nr:DNA-3-methyladenine glycosylase [Paludibacter sp.]MDD4428783.1 DNA-3-methyladenine glycosylase [Paludibacter sp.]